MWVGIGLTTTVTRGVTATVTQYRCGDEQGGPPGCLQYLESTSGKIRSFNFPDITPGATVTYKVAHLVNQHYKICIRRGNGKEVICYTPCTRQVGESSGTAGVAATGQPSFGLSIAETAESESVVDSECSTDYIWIPNAGYVTTGASLFTTAISDQDEPPEQGSTLNRFCGRYLGTDASTYATTGISICSWQTPFEVGVDFDSHEVCTARTDSNTCESQVSISNTGGGGGILGFSLCYIQHTPPITV